MSETHEAALRSFAAGGTGLLAATNAANFLTGLDCLIFGRSRPVSDATKNGERAKYFTHLAERQTAAAQTAHFKAKAPQIASALESIIASRSKNRDAWRGRLSTQIETLERRERLETTMGQDEGRALRATIDTLEGKLVAADATYREAVRLTAALRMPSAGLSTVTDARGYASNINYSL